MKSLNIPDVVFHKKRNRTIGLAFGSGGVKGLAHVGVIKSLLENDIPIDYIAGTSIGAWVGAHYALYQDIEKLEKFTVGRKIEKMQSLLELTLKGGLVKGSKVQNLLDEWLGNMDFESTGIPVKVVATDIISGEQVVFSHGKLAPAVYASMAVPSIFTPYIYHGRILVDGGVSNPVPVNIVKDMGADIVIAVNLDNYRLDGIFEREDSSSLPKVTVRSIDLMRHYLAQFCVKDADVVIEPHNSSEELSKWRNYFTGDIDSLHIRLGQEVTERQIGKIKELIHL